MSSKKITKHKSKKTSKYNKKQRTKKNTNYNPKLKIIPESVVTTSGKDIKINVIRDDLLEAGTKQRAMIPFFKNSKYQEFVYVSPYTGAAQISLAYSAMITNKKVTIFIIKHTPEHALTKRALHLGKRNINIIEIPNVNMKYLEKRATEYIQKKTHEKGDNYITKIELGFDNQEYKNLFIDQLKAAVPKQLKDMPPKRIWVPSGSSIMLNALYEVFPNASFLAVQTGKTIWPDQYNEKNTILYKRDEFFYDRAKIQPPYPTTESYDAKAWKYVLKDGQHEDYIWNITSDVSPLLNHDKNKFKLSKVKPVYKTYKDKHYEFDYYTIKYTNKTTPYLEWIRYQKMTNIINTIIYKLNENNIVLKSGNNTLFNIITKNSAMWISMNLMKKCYLEDPLFPYNAKENEVLIPTFMHLGKLTKSDATKIFNTLDLVQLFNNAILDIYNTKSIKSFVNTKRKGNTLIFMLVNKQKEVLFKVNCSMKVYIHLKKRFIGLQKEINEKIFCLLLRYKTLMGNSHQFAMETKFKDALQREYNIDFECFASAINVHYSKYCSLFYDIEKDFGSYGNFYLIKYKRGFFIANPPYENYMLELMVKKFIKSCKESNDALSISFGLPNWGKYDIFTAIEIVKKAKETKFIRCMKDGEVFWYDRLQGIKVKIPSHCRCVVQNKEGEKKYPISKFNDLINNYWVSS